MTSKSKVTLLVVGLLIATITLASLIVPQTPTYEGKTPEQWLCTLNPDSGKADENRQALVAMRELGASALPQIRRVLRSRPNSPSQKLRALAVRLRLVKAPDLTFPNLQFRAGRAAYALAEDAGVDISSLVPDLRYHLMNTPFSGTEMARALAQAGPQGIAWLTNLLATGSPNVRDTLGVELA
jgi:hypothetical protein